eukprot:9737579-Alexandrium_andersonii.AAC.1
MDALKAEPKLRIPYADFDLTVSRVESGTVLAPARTETAGAVTTPATHQGASSGVAGSSSVPAYVP